MSYPNSLEKPFWAKAVAKKAYSPMAWIKEYALIQKIKLTTL